MQTADFDFLLPPELIAQTPAVARDQSRLLVLDRGAQTAVHRAFTDFLDYISPGDVLVLNDSKVIPARLRGVNPRTGGKFEVLLLEESASNHWWAMVRPGKRASRGAIINMIDRNGSPTAIMAAVTDVNADGHRCLRFRGTENILTELDRLGEVPLPPYIERDTPGPEDRERYQTVFARAGGSVAAPTAGLHFTLELLERIRARGAKVCFITLHVGPGTFAPVKTNDLAGHTMHEERYEVSAETACCLNEGKAKGRIIAVGTTTLRVLESVAMENARQMKPGPGRTRIFIHPPFTFKMADALLTNFHLPRSTLLMLVSAFAAPGELGGRDLVLRAYREAVAQRYRFFSYGDAMLVLTQSESPSITE